MFYSEHSFCNKLLLSQWLCDCTVWLLRTCNQNLLPSTKKDEFVNFGDASKYRMDTGIYSTNKIVQ